MRSDGSARCVSKVIRERIRTVPGEKSYTVVQERKVNVEATSPALAKSRGERMFNAYRIDSHPEVSEKEPIVRQMLYYGLPMYLNVAEAKTVIGHAEVYRDVETGHVSIHIHVPTPEVALMDNLLEICDLKAIGFAGYLKHNVVRGQ